MKIFSMKQIDATNNGLKVEAFTCGLETISVAKNSKKSVTTCAFSSCCGNHRALRRRILIA
jgi:hypothetical protein